MHARFAREHVSSRYISTRDALPKQLARPVCPQTRAARLPRVRITACCVRHACGQSLACMTARTCRARRRSARCAPSAVHIPHAGFEVRRRAFASRQDARANARQTALHCAACVSVQHSVAHVVSLFSFVSACACMCACLDMCVPARSDAANKKLRGAPRRG